MRCPLSIALLSTAFVLPSLAQNDPNQTAPFYLQVVSENATINGNTLVACHEGAAIEGLCLSSQTSQIPTFAFNYTDYSVPFGDLVYNFTFTGQNGLESVWVPAELAYNPLSNVAIPILMPGYGNGQFGFNESDYLSIGGYIDDTKGNSPPTSGNAAYYRWYICDTYYGYSYTTLAWLLGTGTPQNPTCMKVDVKRVFA
jgi:hypothetical protein